MLLPALVRTLIFRPDVKRLLFYNAASPGSWRGAAAICCHAQPPRWHQTACERWHRRAPGVPVAERGQSERKSTVTSYVVDLSNYSHTFQFAFICDCMLMTYKCTILSISALVCKGRVMHSFQVANLFSPVTLGHQCRNHQLLPNIFWNSKPTLAQSKMDCSIIIFY